MVISTPLHSDPVPLRPDELGGLRVGDSRVHLEVVISAYRRGESAESMVQSYPTLELADVYAVIGYYLRHGDEVEEYLRRREEQAQRIRQEIDARQGEQIAALRQRVKERAAQAERNSNAPTGQ